MPSSNHPQYRCKTEEVPWNMKHSIFPLIVTFNNPSQTAISSLYTMDRTEENGKATQFMQFPSEKTAFPRMFKGISLNFFFNFIFKLYKIVLVLPNIKMNPPQVYMCSPS